MDSIPKKQRITAKAAKVKRNEEKLDNTNGTHCLRLIRDSFAIFDQLDQSKQLMPNAEENILFWSELWTYSVEYNKEASWLKGLKNDQ